MLNMAYCRFQNTLADLRDCYEVMGDTEDLSSKEEDARKKLIRLCCDIAEEYGDE